MAWKIPRGLVMILVIISMVSLRQQTEIFTPKPGLVEQRIPKPIDEMQRISSIVASNKLFKSWEDYSISTWCNISHTNSSAPDLVLIKVPKSASSTAAGVVLRIAHQHSCSLSWEHQQMSELVNVTKSSYPASFFVAPIRKPHSRALSFVYYHATFSHRKGINDAFVLKKLRQQSPNYALNYMSPEAHPIVSSQDTTIQAVTRILASYSFLMVVERMDESLVVLSHLMNISLQDVVLVTSAKASGSWYNANKQLCIQLLAPRYSDEVESFFQSSEWIDKHWGDYLLYAAANQSLDHSIRRIGKAKFDRDMKRLQNMQEYVHNLCSNQTILPCSTAGVPQVEKSRKNCYARDFGCGYPCANRILQNLSKSNIKVRF